MLIGKSNSTVRANSTYICDRCKIDMITREKYTIAVGKGKLSCRKKWDLCEHCYSLLVKGINKGVNKNVKKI